MVTIKIDGGLGNQLFQYAFIKSLADKRNEQYRLDIGSYEISGKRGKLGLRQLQVANVFTKRKHLFTNLFLLRLLRKWKIGKFGGIYIETSSSYNPEVYNNCCNYFYGYFQSFKYFDRLRPVLQAEFEFTEGKQSIYFNEILRTESVGIHVRKGDYLSNKQVFDLMVQLDVDYYLAAARQMVEIIGQPVHFFLFSNDVMWVREHLLDALKMIGPCTLVQHDTPLDELYDLECLKNCKHQVISNSTFGWWAAYLNNYDKKNVIVPRQWYKKSKPQPEDLYPGSYILL